MYRPAALFWAFFILASIDKHNIWIKPFTMLLIMPYGIEMFILLMLYWGLIFLLFWLINTRTTTYFKPPAKVKFSQLKIQVFMQVFICIFVINSFYNAIMS